MEQMISIEKRIQKVLANDPLFQVIHEASEVASWFTVTDAQLHLKNAFNI